MMCDYVYPAEQYNCQRCQLVLAVLVIKRYTHSPKDQKLIENCKMPSDKSKACIVPSCKATDIDFPDRIFFPVPENKKKKWLEIVKGDRETIEPNKRLFCCESHFSVHFFSLHSSVEY